MKTPIRLKPADYERTRYFVTVEPGIPFSAVLTTGFWAHVHKTLKPFDVIEVVALDGSFDADIRLISYTPTQLKWRVLRETHGEAGSVEVETESAFKVSHKGRGQWGVQDRRSGEWLAEGLSKEDAEATKASLDAERQAA